MDEKTLTTLEFPKILERIAAYAAFSPTAEKASALRPTTDLVFARRRQAETAEAVQLLATHPDLTIGGARDVRQQVNLASHAGLLTPFDLLDIKSTLIAGRTLVRTFERLGGQFPMLDEIAARMPIPVGLIDRISRAISDRGELLDSASPQLAVIRRDLRVVHDRLLTKMQRMVTDSKITQYLQETLVTQRDGRYVLPLRAEFKGRIRAVVHDQSASGATLFVEPLSVVEMNNQYRELQLAERDEERRILADLSGEVGASSAEIEAMIDNIAELDLALAKAKYAQEIEALEPSLLEFPAKGHAIPGGNQHPGSTIRMFGARHPLLDPETVVPVDVDLDPQTFCLVITGPNTGGKTVTLKTIGLLSLMAQSGLHLPVAAGSEISVFEKIFADIGDEQSIEQSLSTFSGHITNIIHLLGKADRRSLVIMDELGAGTDPQEGAALARALLTHLLKRSITTLVTTHHPELKAYAHATPGVVNASVEFDLESLQPTYHLTIGLPGRSNALAIAERLGMPKPIVSGARSEINPADLRAENLLEEIHRQRDLARQARHQAEQARQEVEDLRYELVKRLEEIEDERREILDQARQDASQQVEELGVELGELRRALSVARQPLDALEIVEKSVAALDEEYEEPVERRPIEAEDIILDRPVRLGDKVRLRSLNTKGVVTSLGEHEVEIQVGTLRVRTRISEIEPLQKDEESEPAGVGDVSRKPAQESQRSKRPEEGLNTPSPGIELDLRGQRADDALDQLERYLDAAYLSGLPFVRIIHGKGTGKLRQAVREALGVHPHIRSFEPGGVTEGGDGVTVAKLQTI
jgi:DNA mismatch repair protein MutS2